MQNVPLAIWSLDLFWSSVQTVKIQLQNVTVYLANTWTMNLKYNAIRINKCKVAKLLVWKIKIFVEPWKISNLELWVKFLFICRKFFLFIILFLNEEMLNFMCYMYVSSDYSIYLCVISFCLSFPRYWYSLGLH